jgi:7,8-dihydropterin-6-yl-methyl-4-(beta-D-ribofuranosyl)aminobenzene 5'-phosphate synthase
MNLDVIDSCDVTVLIDNVMDILSTTSTSVTGHVPNVFKAGASELSGACLCCAHWGLSLVITAQGNDKKQTLLFDSGPEGEALERNGKRLGIDFSSIDAVMFSHGHWDHVGGMLSAIKQIYNAKDNKKVPVHVNDDMFVHRGIRSQEGKVIPFEDLPTKRELEEVGGAVHSIADEQVVLDSMFYISGEIPRVTAYEKGLPTHVKDIGNGWELDPWIMDERYTAVHIKDKGILVFTACSHAGVINVLKDAQTRFDPIPLYGVMGGFHLSGKECEAIIPETIRDLREFNLNLIIPGHCTGWRAVQKLVEEFGEEVVIMSAVGNSYSF